MGLRVCLLQLHSNLCDCKVTSTVIGPLNSYAWSFTCGHPPSDFKHKKSIDIHRHLHTPLL